MAASGKKNMFNEATRVQMPAMVHLTRLGYTYFGKITEDMAGTVYDPDTNILINVFKEQFIRLNPTHAGEAEQTLKTIRQELDNDDIGRSFYERLSSVSPVRLVDFENPKNNTYHFTAEFTCKRDQDEFRPDITLFVNGLPLVFVEVKKPNNHGGMVAEKENHYGYVIDFANIKRNFEETNEAYLKELNRFNDPNEVGAGNETDTFKQVIEDPAELIKQMQEVQQVLFNYTTDNAEEFSSEISTIEDKQELLKLKKILIAARDCCNLVRTFGDDELKETFAKMELTKLPSLISEVQHHIDNINQKELFASDDTTKLLVNEAMEDITFNFSKISEEELKIVGGKDAVTEKYKKTVRAFTQNIDPDDPEFITLQEAFLLRFKQHGFEPKSVSEIEEQGKELEDILKKLDELQKKNTVLLRKYNGDAKFARVHKRIREENLARKAANKQPIVSEYDMSIMNVLLSIKSDIDQKVYDRNDILKKDAYFERTVMTQIKAGIDKLGVASAREDRVFIQSRITKQYLDQYNQTYSVA